MWYQRKVGDYFPEILVYNLYCEGDKKGQERKREVRKAREEEWRKE
jgi:hypothetical protein